MQQIRLSNLIQIEISKKMLGNVFSSVETGWRYEE